MKISVIIPANNSEQYIGECLSAIRAAQPPVHEVIVVNDGSSDRTAAVAEEEGARVVTLDVRHDTNYCRNRGAAEATGEVLLFLDSDVVLQPNTVKYLTVAFSGTTTDAIVGVYSARHRHPFIASQYKNLWIRYSYLRSNAELDWIFGAVVAIRAEAFRTSGGFNPRIAMQYGGEDLELGKRMTRTQYAIRLDPSVEVEHLKCHTLTSLLRNDYMRSQGFIVLAGELGQLGRSMSKGFANVYPLFAYSVPLAWLMFASAIALIWMTSLIWLLLAFKFVYLLLNSPFLLYYRRQRGNSELLQAIGILFLDHLVCGVGSLQGLVKWLIKR